MQEESVFLKSRGLANILLIGKHNSGSAILAGREMKMKFYVRIQFQLRNVDCK